MKQHQQLNSAASPGVRLLAAIIQEGVTPEGPMLGGVVEAEGSVGQTHPREDEAGSSTQERQLGEDGRDESLWAAARESRGTKNQVGSKRQLCLIDGVWVRGQNSPCLCPKGLQPQGAEAETIAGSFRAGQKRGGSGLTEPTPACMGSPVLREGAITQHPATREGAPGHIPPRGRGRGGSVPHPTTGAQER